MNLPKVDVDTFNKDGFLLIKNVLSLDEVNLLRQTAYDTIKNDEQSEGMFYHRFAKNHLGCLTNIENFKKLVLDDRVIHIAREILGAKPCFFGDSIFEIGIGNRGFHKDTSNRKDPNHPDWTETYPIIRVALYLQDHKHHSGGVKVRRGSHNTIKTNVGEPIIVPSEPGDIVVFSLRASHAGNAVRLKIAPNTSIHHRIEKRIPNFLKVPEESDRVSIFLTYGLKTEALDRYINFMLNHNVYQKRIAHSSYPQDLIDEIENKIDFINLKEYSLSNA